MHTGGDPHRTGSMIAGLVDVIRGAKGPGGRAKRSSKKIELARLLLTLFMLGLPFILIILVVVWATSSQN